MGLVRRDWLDHKLSAPCLGVCGEFARNSSCGPQEAKEVKKNKWQDQEEAGRREGGKGGGL